MAVATLKKIWRNEYFQTAIMIILINATVFGFWYGVKLVLKTEYPALAVASGSMLPTLNVGDLIIVQGTPPDQINASYITGDIIVFWRSGELIVHRAVYKEQKGDVYYFKTHGDNNPTDNNEGPFPESDLVGKVVGRIPNVGNFALLVHTQENMYLFIIIMIILFIMLFMFPFGTEEEEKTTEEKQAEGKSKLFGKIDIRIVYLLVLNLFIISIIVFNLWGALTFWNPGASPNWQSVTIRGMYPDAQYHQSDPLFKPPNNYNNIHNVSLSQGFLTYTINCFVSDGSHEGMRLGVPTFSFTQVAIIILILFNVWELIKFVESRKIVETRTET